MSGKGPQERRINKSGRKASSDKGKKRPAGITAIHKNQTRGKFSARGMRQNRRNRSRVAASSGSSAPPGVMVQKTEQIRPTGKMKGRTEPNSGEKGGKKKLHWDLEERRNAVSRR